MEDEQDPAGAPEVEPVWMAGDLGHERLRPAAAGLGHAARPLRGGLGEGAGLGGELDVWDEDARQPGRTTPASVTIRSSGWSVGSSGSASTSCAAKARPTASTGPRARSASSVRS